MILSGYSKYAAQTTIPFTEVPPDIPTLAAFGDYNFSLDMINKNGGLVDPTKRRRATMALQSIIAESAEDHTGFDLFASSSKTPPRSQQPADEDVVLASVNPRIGSYRSTVLTADRHAVFPSHGNQESRSGVSIPLPGSHQTATGGPHTSAAGAPAQFGRGRDRDRDHPLRAAIRSSSKERRNSRGLGLGPGSLSGSSLNLPTENPHVGPSSRIGRESIKSSLAANRPPPDCRFMAMTETSTLKIKVRVFSATV